MTPVLRIRNIFFRGGPFCCDLGTLFFKFFPTSRPHFGTNLDPFWYHYGSIWLAKAGQRAGQRPAKAGQGTPPTSFPYQRLQLIFTFCKIQQESSNLTFLTARRYSSCSKYGRGTKNHQKRMDFRFFCDKSFFQSRPGLVGLREAIGISVRI